MRQILFITCFLLRCLAAAGQVYFPELGQLPIRRYAALEARLHSARLPDKEVLFVGADFELGPTQQYSRRKSSVRPRPVVSYTYSLPDSVVRIIEVELDSLNYLGDSYEVAHRYREPITRYPPFLAAYAQMERELIARLGKPTESKPAHKETTSFGESYEQSANWATPTLDASLELVFSLSTKSVPGPPNSLILSVGGNYSYHVRATIKYKKLAGTANQLPVPATSTRQQAVAKQYMALVLAGKLAESWALLGPDITQSMTFEQYRSRIGDFLAKLPGAAQGASLFMAGPSFTGDGQAYAIYTFRLNADKSNPPATVINLLFKDLQTELISGIQPSTRAASVPAAN